MIFDRDLLASAVVGSGGAWMLASALYHARSGRYTSAQIKGLVYTGGGFLMSAAAARWLQHTGPRGIAISLLGTFFAMRGIYLLVRERAARNAASRDAAPPEPPPTD